ncbi:MAG: hypothetical protein ACRD1I_08485, partial [Terriglobia bacterium]
LNIISSTTVRRSFVSRPRPIHPRPQAQQHEYKNLLKFKRESTRPTRLSFSIADHFEKFETNETLYFYNGLRAHKIVICSGGLWPPVFTIKNRRRGRRRYNRSRQTGFEGLRQPGGALAGNINKIPNGDRPVYTSCPGPIQTENLHNFFT